MVPRRLALTLLGVLAIVRPASGQEPPLLTYSITGSARSDPENRNPLFLLGHVEVQRLLLELAPAPRPRSDLEDALDGSEVRLEDLEAAGILRRDGEHDAIDFTLLTGDDLAKVSPLAEREAHSLAEAFLAHRAELARLVDQAVAPGVDPGMVAFVLLGCFALDWDGLALTAAGGYRAEARAHPAGEYLLSARQTEEGRLRGMFWGSHNRYGDEYVLTSFGDHHALPRAAFPDLIGPLARAMRTSGIASFDAFWPGLARVGARTLDRLAEQVARTMFALRDGPRPTRELVEAIGIESAPAEDLLALLEDLQYVRRRGDVYSAAVPVLVERDRAVLTEVLALSRRILEPWLAARYDRIKEDLAGITPLRHGVAFEEVFNQLWHWIFGTANRQLVEAKLFADPYAPERRYQGFIPMIWHPALQPARLK